MRRRKQGVGVLAILVSLSWCSAFAPPTRPRLSPVSPLGVASTSRLSQAEARLRDATRDIVEVIDESSGIRRETRVRELRLKFAEPEVDYDPARLEQELFRQPARWLQRNVQLFLPLTGFVLTVLGDIQAGTEQKNRRRRAAQLLDIIGGLGPAIIKAGQALSSRPDLLPSEYLEELQKLQDRLPPSPTANALTTVTKELGRPWEDIFELVEPEPVAAASIGQVYKARLLSNGHVVAIKVQRPGCEETIALDLYIMRWYAGLMNMVLRLLNRNVDLQGVIDDFGELIYREIDYRAEMVNGQRFGELYANIPGVFVPKVYSDLTTKRILVTEWVEGCRLTSADTLRDNGIEPSYILDTLVQCSLRQMLENGLFHADPHLGNLLAFVDEQGQPRLAFLDFGMVSYVEASQRLGIVEAVVHLVNRDFVSLADLYKRFGFIPQDQDPAPIVRALERALPDVLDSSVSEFNIRNVLLRLGDVIWSENFALPPYYIAILRCLGVLEGVALQSDPSFRIIRASYGYIASRLLTDSAPELQHALRQLLFKDGVARWERFEELLEEAQGTRDYDVTLAVTQIIDYLLSEQGAPILKDLSEQLVDGIDTLSVDTLEYALRNARELGTGTIPALLRGDQRAYISEVLLDDENLTPTMTAALRIVSLLIGSKDFDLQKVLPLARRLVTQPESQQVLVYMAQGVGERAVSRVIRRLFGVSMPPRPTSTAGMQAGAVTTVAAMTSLTTKK